MKFGIRLPRLGPPASVSGSVALARRPEQPGSVRVGDHIMYPPALVERFGALAILDRQATPEKAQPLVGPPDVLIEMLRRFGAAGLDHVILSPYYGLQPALLPNTLEAVEETLARWSRDVRPHL
jgi:hypothetical protein